MGLVLCAGLLTSLGVRSAPLVEGGDRLKWQCVSEDGYLMQTIARNVALGHGFSVSGGDIKTNGTQPLATILYAAGFRAAEGDREDGLYWVVAFQLFWALLTAAVLFRFVGPCFLRSGSPSTGGRAAAAIWLLSPTTMMHGQNGLETGLYLFLVLVTAAAYDLSFGRMRSGIRWSGSVMLGSLLGLSFLGRNDGCFLGVSVALIHLYRCRKASRWPGGVLEVSVMGLTALVWASPWLWYNVVEFGHVVPVSGRAETRNVPFAYNLGRAFQALVEDVLLVIRIPGSVEAHPIVRWGSTAIVVGLLIVGWSRRRALVRRFSPGMGILVLFVGMLFVFYSLFFGMPVFLGRYFAPVTLCSTVAAGVWVSVRAVSPSRPVRLGTSALVVALTVVATGLNLRQYSKGTKHLHAQVVDWVARHVSESEWVAATQTGTLGFYHDRTVNLDGKVNPVAFRHRQQGTIADYLIEANVEYIVDWAGHAAWADIPAFARNYKLELVDQERNLAVLKRRRSPTADGWAPSGRGRSVRGDEYSVAVREGDGSPMVGLAPVLNGGLSAHWGRRLWQN